MLRNRRLDVLRAIVSDYVETQEPVGSKALVQRHRLGVSAATIRNDMAALEEDGYIRQPHTSAGRIPTDKGYRYFVDQIDQVKPLSAPERRAITEFFTESCGIEDVMENTVRLLAHLTHQTAVVEFPDFQQSQLRHLELVRLGAEDSRKVLAVIIADTGRVDQILVELPESIDEAALRDLAVQLAAIFASPALAETGTGCTKRGETLVNWVNTLPAFSRENAAVLVKAIDQALAQGQAETRIVMAGMANLSRSGDFTDTLTPLVEALEEQVVLLKLFNEIDIRPHQGQRQRSHCGAAGGAAAGDSPVSVIIGQESGHEALAGAAIVSSSYDAVVGTSHIGVIGPTRMDYPGSIAAVKAVARYLSRILNQ